MKNNAKQTNENTFYSGKGIAVLIIAVVIFAIASFVAMYSLGLIKLPSFISDNLIQTDKIAVDNGENIAPPETADLLEALPAGEYAIALAGMPIPNAYYRSYSVTIFSGAQSTVTDYVVIKNGDDWWVQTSQNGVILTTAFQKDGKVVITDNASNQSVSDSSDNRITLKEQCAVMPLYELVNIIKSLESSEESLYGGGINTYSLSFTQSRNTGENLFNFSFTCANEISEEYIFGFESAAILSAKKSFNGELIYSMELKDSRNDLNEIDIDALFGTK